VIALAHGSGVLFVDYEFFLAPGAEKRELRQPRLRQHLGFGRLPALGAKDKSLAVYLHISASFASICRLFRLSDPVLIDPTSVEVSRYSGGTGRT